MLLVVPRFARQEDTRSGRYKPRVMECGLYLPDRESSRRRPNGRRRHEQRRAAVI